VALRSLQKWHGAGNDFLVDVQLYGRPSWWTPERVRAACARTTGVGADGVIVASLGPRVQMTLFNADGSRAEMSGNGARCLAAAVRRAVGSEDEALEIDTDAGPRTVTLRMDPDSEMTSGYGEVAMGEVSFVPAPAGALGAAHVGNPHVVVADDPALDDPAREALAARLAGELGGANVEFVRVESPERISMRVIERGVGWTLACGTGSCAAAAVARRAGLVGDVVEVANPGGDLRVTLEGARATLAGPVRFVANVEWLEA
jgi:diaminopimelate epimerase